MVLKSDLELILAKFVVCWVYCFTHYLATIRPPINVWSHARDVYTSSWVGVLEVPHWLKIRLIHNI